jgi:hypothetical protein
MVVSARHHLDEMISFGIISFGIISFGIIQFDDPKQRFGPSKLIPAPR